MRLRIRPTFVAYLASMALLASPACALGAVCALTVHELGHALAARLLGERICAVELAPFGGVMTYAPGYSPAKGLRGIALAAAGPLGNELALLLLGAATRSEMLCSLMGGELLRQMIGFLLQRRLFDLKLHDLTAQLIHLGRHGIHLGLYERTRLVYQVDCLIRQETIGNVAV